MCKSTKCQAEYRIIDTLDECKDVPRTDEWKQVPGGKLNQDNYLVAASFK